MTRQRAILRVISVVLSVVFFWTNCVWAEVGLSYKLAAPHQAPLVSPNLGRLLLGAKIVQDLGIKSLKDVVNKMKELEEKGIICFSRTDTEGRVANYIFGEDGTILRVKSAQEANDDLYRLLNVQGTVDGDYEWIRLEQYIDRLDAVNSFLQGINPDWRIRIPQGLAYNSKEIYERYIPQRVEEKLGGRVDELKDKEKINAIADEANAFTDSIDKIEFSEALSVDGFVNDEDYQKYYDEAMDLVLMGKYIPEFFFAGAADRMKEGAMYPLDLYNVATKMGLEIPDDALRIGMGPRQILQYRLFLERLASSKNMDVKDVLARSRMVIHINTGLIIDDFVRHNFYGFNPDNVIFITQHVYNGCRLENGEFILDRSSRLLPTGHGYSTAQLIKPNAGVIVSRGGIRRVLDEDVVSYLLRQGAEVMCAHRINDLTKWTDHVVELDKLAYAIKLFEGGFNVVIPLVGNPRDQKGGQMARFKGQKKKFLLEKLNAQTPELSPFWESKKNAPYNAMRNIYKLDELRRVLRDGLPNHIRFRNGYFYLESATGDLTQSDRANTEAVVKEGEVIHDCKAPNNIPEALGYMLRQDSDPDFMRLVKGTFGMRQAQHLLPGYLYDAFRTRLIQEGLVTDADADSFISQISYIDANGVVHIAGGYKYGKAVGIMAEVLSEELSKKAGKKRVVRRDDVIKVLQMHEEIHRIIREYKIDIKNILDSLIAFYSGDVDTLLLDFARNYDYLPGKDLTTYQLTQNDRLMLVEELLVHTLIERRNFDQPVRVIDQTGTRVDLDTEIEKILVSAFASKVIERFSAVLENVDKNYLLALYNKFLLPLVSPLKIKENFFPSAMLSEQERQNLLGAVEYGELAGKPQNADSAKSVQLTLNPMDGGIGAAVKRLRYLEGLGKFKGYDKDGKPILGSKSSDLYFKVNGKSISVMEAKLIRAIIEARRGTSAYKEVKYQLLGGGEARQAIEEILDKPCLLDSTRTYREYIQQETDLRIEDVLLQASLPTVEKARSPGLTTERKAPGGHGQWGAMILMDALGIQLPSDGTTVIRAFYNGDGINNGTDPVITGWMARESVPIIMISTTKTGIDKKGGQIGVQYLGPNRTKSRIQMMELAQAKQAGQEQLFYRIGLPEGEKDGAEPDKQYFNTNTALLNYSVLTPFLNELVNVIGLDRFVEIIAPDLIQNEKEQAGKKFIQLEGALGSALLNLAAFIETTEDAGVKAVIQKHGISKFLRIVNVDKLTRTKFFTPQKNTFDYWYQFHSGRFRYDTATRELVDNYPDRPLPVIDLVDDYYADVQDVIDAFNGVDVNELESLTIKGKVKLAGAQLKGTVCILNGTKETIDLNDPDVRQKLEVKDLNMPDVKKTLDDYIVNGRLVLENILIAYGPAEAVGIDRWINILEYMKADPSRLDSYINKLQQEPSKSIGGKVWLYVVKHAKLFPEKDARELFDMYFIEQRKLVELEIKQGKPLLDAVLGYTQKLKEISKMLESAGLGGIRYISYMYDVGNDRSFSKKLLEEGKGGFRILGSDSRDKCPGAAALRVQEQYSHRIYGREKDELIECGVKIPLRCVVRYTSKHFDKEVSVWTITNQFPIFDRHIQLIWPEGMRQRMNLGFLRLTLEFLKNTPGMNGFFNSIGANASQNHPHVQLFPETDNNMPLDTVDVEGLFTKAGIKVGAMGRDKLFPVSGFVFEPVDQDSATLDNLAIMVQALVEDMMIKNIPYNLVFRNNRVYVFPRNPLPAGEFGQSFAGAEMIGHLLLTAKELLYTPWVKDHPEVMNIDRYNRIQEDLRKGVRVEEHGVELEGYVTQAVEHLSFADIRKAYERVCLNPDSTEFRILRRDLEMIGDVIEMQGNAIEGYIKGLDADEFYLKLILLRTRIHPERDKRIYEEINFLLEREELIMAGKQLSLDIENLGREMKGLRYKILLEKDKEKKRSLKSELEKRKKQLSHWRELLNKTRIEFGFDEPLASLVSDELRNVLGEVKISASSLSKNVDMTRPQVIYSRIKIDTFGNIVGIEELVDGERVDKKAIQGMIDYIKGLYGEGVLGSVREIVIVDNLGGIDSEIPEEQKGGAAYFVGEKMVVDRDVFKHPVAKNDVGVHEALEATLRLVETNPGVQEVTATYCALEKILELSPEELDSYIEFLKQPDNGLDSMDYAGLLEAIRERKGRLTREDLIGLAIGYVLNTPRYSHLKDSLAGVLPGEIEKAKEKLELARNIYRDIVEAKKDVIGELKGMVKPVIDQARIAKAKMKVRMIVSSLPVKTIGFVDALVKNNKYILLDRDELTKPENRYIMDWINRITEGKERSPFIFSDEEIPDGVKAEDIIYLIEPERVNEQLGQDRLYLPLPYSVSSIYLASQVVLAGGKVSGITDKLVLNTIRTLYETLLGRDITEAELEQLFRMPWTVLPPIVQISATLDALRKAITQIEVAA